MVTVYLHGTPINGISICDTGKRSQAFANIPTTGRTPEIHAILFGALLLSLLPDELQINIWHPDVNLAVSKSRQYQICLSTVTASDRRTFQTCKCSPPASALLDGILALLVF